MEAVALGHRSDRDLSEWRLDLDHPGRGESQSDRCETLGFKIRQGPRYARTGFPEMRHVGLILTGHRDSVITRLGDSLPTWRDAGPLVGDERYAPTSPSHLYVFQSQYPARATSSSCGTEVQLHLGSVAPRSVSERRPATGSATRWQR